MNKKEIAKKDTEVEAAVEQPVVMNQKVEGNKATPSNQAKGKKSFVLNNTVLILAAGVVVLLVLAWIFFVFLPNTYRFSFPVNGLTYYSNDYTPSEFFGLVRDSNSVIISVELVDNELDVWAVNAWQLWIVALVFDKKEVLQVVKSVDSFGNLQYCSMNDSNVLQERKLSAVECSAFLADSNYLSINIRRSSENKVILGRTSADIFAQKGESMTWVNYSMMKNVYSNFDQILAIFHEKFQEKKDSAGNSMDLNQSK